VAAVEIGVDMIELDVIKTRSGRMLVAHDYLDVSEREPLTLAEGLDLFTREPLDRVEIDCDLKVPAGEEELLAALRERELVGRAMVSTAELASLAELRRLEPELRLGWGYPKVRRDWATTRWAAPAVAGAVLYLRRQLPWLLARKLRRGLEIDEIWPYHRLASRRLVEVAERHGLQVIPWTVDELEPMRRLAEIGVHGICSNDPRLFDRL
jgi:glycerophosphoryl diester phosphodiesterase